MKDKSTFFFATAWAFFMALVSEPLMAHEGDDVPVDSLSEVVVAAMRPVYSLQSPSPVQTLDGTALRRMNSLSVADAVRYFSGVQIKDYGGVGGLKTINIRSMGSQHTGVFYDGIQLGNAQNGQIDLGRFSLDNMEAVSVYNGQKNDLLQSAKDFGAAGSIYLTSAKPHFAEGETTRIRAGYKTALYEARRFVSYGLTNPSLLWQQRLGSKISSSVGAEWLNSNGRYLFRERVLNNDGSVAYDTTAIRENGDVNALRLEGGLNGTIDGGEWNAKLYYYRSERGLPGPTVRNVYQRDQRLWDENFFAQGAANKRFGRLTSKLSAKYANDYTRYVDHDEASLWTDNVYRQQEAYLSSANSLEILPWLSAALSFDFQYNTMAANLDNFSEPQRVALMAAVASAVSFDWMKLRISLLSVNTHDKVRRNKPVGDQHPWSPALSVSFKPFRAHDLYLRAFYKHSFRLPTFNDLYYTIVGMADLRPERAVQYDAGLTWGRFFDGWWHNVTLTADVYHNLVNDKIIAMPTSKFFRWTTVNLGRVKVWGTDISAQTGFRICQVYLKTGLNYTWQRAEDRSDASQTFYGHQIPYTPWHSGSVLLSGDWRSWGFSYSFIYVGERYSQQENIAVNHLQPWYTSDIALHGAWNIGKIRIKCSFEVGNLLNQYYAVVVNYPMPGRNFKIGCHVEI